jgi:hypothetical protein
MHEGCVAAVVGSPMAFFDTTPLGRILNRFSTDLQERMSLPQPSRPCGIRTHLFPLGRILNRFSTDLQERFTRTAPAPPAVFAHTFPLLAESSIASRPICRRDSQTPSHPAPAVSPLLISTVFERPGRPPARPAPFRPEVCTRSSAWPHPPMPLARDQPSPPFSFSPSPPCPLFRSWTCSSA